MFLYDIAGNAVTLSLYMMKGKLVLPTFARAPTQIFLIFADKLFLHMAVYTVQMVEGRGDKKVKTTKSQNDAKNFEIRFLRQTFSVNDLGLCI